MSFSPNDPKNEPRDLSDPFPLLPLSRVSDIEPLDTSETWLIDSLWARSGVGIIGGAPKCCKTWLYMAISVASGTPA